MFVAQPTATCTVVQAGVNATPGQQVGVSAACQLSPALPARVSAALNVFISCSHAGFRCPGLAELKVFHN
jgi:hypothetical protein